MVVAIEKPEKIVLEMNLSIEFSSGMDIHTENGINDERALTISTLPKTPQRYFHEGRPTFFRR